MLIFTHRKLDTTKADEAVFTKAYAPFSPALSAAGVAAVGAGANWAVSAPRENLTDKDAIALLSGAFSAGRPVLVYLHGNNNTPATCFDRCKQLEDQYGVSVIGYSWASEGFQPDGSDLAGISANKQNTDADEESLGDVRADRMGEGWIQRKARRYGQGKLNAQHSTAALARFLRLVAATRLALMTQRYSLAAHSLGVHYLHYTIDQEGAGESLAAAHNVALIAGCTGAAKHAAWVARIRPVLRTYIMYTRADTVLAAAKIIDGDVKLGADPGAERLSAPGYRYVDFAGAAKMATGAHRYFVHKPGKSLSTEAARLFSHLFNSELDIEPGKDAKTVYPLRCSPDGSVCHMGNPGNPIGNGGQP